MDINKEKIDIVYTWVDGNDLSWNKKKEQYLIKEGLLTDINNSECRYRDNDELKYSLRSLEKYANWINKVYIITDNQIPKWLNLSNARIKIVDHKDIIPQEYLPVFNSCVIEHFMTNIDGLSEYFLYANDDMFFANYVKPDFFYKKDGYPIFRYTNNYEKSGESLYKTTVKNADILVSNKFNKRIMHFPHHNIDAYKKSDFINCQTVFQNEINKSISSKFRNKDIIQRTIYANYSLAIKHGKYKRILESIPMYSFYKYIPLLRKTIRNYNEHFTQETMYICPHYTDYNNFKMNPNTKLFCINDDEKSDNQDRINSKNFLNMLFPEKSSFEL